MLYNTHPRCESGFGVEQFVDWSNDEQVISYLQKVIDLREIEDNEK